MVIEFDGSADTPFFQDPRESLRLPLERLDGDVSERIFQRARRSGEAFGVQLYDCEDLLIGCILQPLAGETEATTLEFYRRLLRAAGGRPLYRIWNYVPDINETWDEFENYSAFSAGRARAFEEAFGAGYRAVLPAASAVGCRGKTLAAVFVAGRAAPRHVENPEQIPAYNYPREHGPRPPSFSRATVARHLGRDLIFISGTAAIKGHATVAPGDLQGQIDCTLDNLRLISRAAGAGDNLGREGGFVRHFKVYLRRAEDLPAARARLEEALLLPDDHVIWLHTGLCRAALGIEIEATLLRA